jgi:AcrR family transcriptional regulator
MPDGRPQTGTSEDGALPPASERLLETAATLFCEQSYARATTRELAERLGIQKASLYHHISGKEDLLYEISLKSLRDLGEVVGAVWETEPPETRLRQMIATHLDAALDEREMHMTMLVELRVLSPERRADIVERRGRYEELLRTAIAADQEDGRLRTDIDPKYLTLALLNLLNWTIWWFQPDGDLGAPELGDLLADIFLDGARPRP